MGPNQVVLKLKHVFAGESYITFIPLQLLFLEDHLFVLCAHRYFKLTQNYFYKELHVDGINETIV